MATLLLSYDLVKNVVKKGKFKNFSINDLTFKFEVEIDDPKNLGDNALLMQRCSDQCHAVIDKGEKELLRDLKDLEDNWKDGKNSSGDVKKIVVKAFDSMSDDVDSTVRKVFAQAIKDPKAYRRENKKSGLKIAIAAGGVVASTTIAVTTGASGVGLAVGIVGIARSVVAGLAEAQKLIMDAVTVSNMLHTNLMRLRTQVKSGAKAVNTMKEAGKAVLNNVLAIEVESVVVSVEGVDKLMDLLEQKLRPARIKLVKAAQPITKLVEEAQKLADDIAKLEKVKSLTKEQDAALKKLQKDEDDIAAELDPLLKRVSEAMQKVSAFERQLEVSHGIVKDLKAKYNKNVVKGVDVASKLIVAAGSFVTGNFNNPGEAVKQLTDNIHDAADQAGLVLDAAMTVKDGYETFRDLIKG